MRKSLAVLAFVIAPSLAAAQFASPPPAAGRAYFWEVSSLTNTVYLFGTVHAGKRSFYPLPPAVEKAFGDAKVHAVEADITNAEAMQKGAATLTLTPPDRLDKHVPAALYERFRTQADRLGLPEAQLAQLKPFMAASLLAFSEWGKQGYHPQYGVDLNLILKARETGKKIVELEGAQMQTALIDSLTPEQGRQAFEGTVLALESGLTRDQINGMVEAWQAGDPQKLLQVASQYNDRVPGAKDIEEKFIWSRHDAMVGKIEGYLLEGRERVFVGVGALHLAGPRGLVEMLRKRGYTVKQP
jgi:uncharacterized protein YbaP (TraB family)